MKKNRNILTLFLLLILFTVFMLSGCSSDKISENSDDIDETETSAVQQTEIADTTDTSYTENANTDIYETEESDEITSSDDTLAAGHTHEYSFTTVPSSCTEPGYTEYKCLQCGDTYADDYTAEMGHELTVVETSAPTCNEDGRTVYKCNSCEYTKEEYSPSLPHSYNSSVTDATCTEGGYTTHTCKNCLHSFTDSITKAKGHTYKKSVIQATCTEGGYTSYSCNCGDTYTGSLTSAKGHSFGEWITVKEPTEQSDGTAERTCRLCKEKESKVLNKLIPQHTHKYTSSIKKSPTCTESGILQYKCNCGASYTESIKALSHSYKQTLTAPTCTEQGYTTHLCSKCGNSYKDTYTNAKGHSYSTPVTVVATCTKDGYTVHKCKICTYSYTDGYVPAHHKYTDIVTKATCTEDGYTTHKCTECSYSYTDTKVKASGHSYSHKITSASCLEKGYTTHTCSKCGNSYKDTYTNATGHSYSLSKRTPSTCVVNGNNAYRCANCGHTYTEALPLSDHLYQYATISATCTEKGYKKYTCKVCGDSYTDSERDALGHKYTFASEDNGIITYGCERCNNSSYKEYENARYDASLTPPEILYTFSRNPSTTVYSESQFSKDNGYMCQGMVSNSSDFQKNTAIEYDLYANNKYYYRMEFPYRSGTNYYKLRMCKMDGDVFVYGPWTDVIEYDVYNFTKELNKKPKYTYELYSIDGNDKVYNEIEKLYFLKTDNPNPDSIMFYTGKAQTPDHFYATTFVDGLLCTDIEYMNKLDHNTSVRKVDGGYVLRMYAREVGVMHLELREGTADGYIKIRGYDINVLDYEKAEIEWIDNAIAKNTTAQMTSKEKLEAVIDYIEACNFKYLTNRDGTKLIRLARQPNDPWFLSYRWDSMKSPAVLAKIAERIGGFEKVVNCYTSKEHDWSYHHMACVTYKGQEYYYTVSPLAQTGAVNENDLKKIDFTSPSELSQFYKIP